MIYKSREKSTELIIYELLDQRMSLHSDDQRHFMNVYKGYKGELIFDSLCESFSNNFAIVNDLLLEFNYSTFQIDSLILTGDTAHFIEIKNYEGEHFYDKGRLYRVTGKERDNPLIQLKRSETLLRQLFQHLHFPLPVVSHVIFIHSNFTLFQAPQRTSFILPTQINSFIQSLAKSSPFDNSHQYVVLKLLSMHQKENRFSRIPVYQYDSLRKGMKCVVCKSLSIIMKERYFICQKCNATEKFESGIVRSMRELASLFPNMKITTNILMDWCQLDCPKRRVRRVLIKNFEKIGATSGTTYK